LGANVYVTRKIPEPALDMLRSFAGRVDVNPDDRVLARAELLGAVAGRDGVLCLLTDRIDAEVFDAAGPGCKAFANCAVGYDNVDVAEATKRGVIVTNTPGVLTDTTADLAWALIFSVARRVVEGDSLARSGRWAGWGPMQVLGRDIAGATLRRGRRAYWPGRRRAERGLQDEGPLRQSQPEARARADARRPEGHTR
jgi:lactate dehydrogenase-like 2-hydroxyacid dehydrogenase